MNARRFLIFLALCIGVLTVGGTLATLGMLGDAPPVVQAETDGVLTVCKTGPPDCEYSVIQDAVDAASDGDIVKVAAGVYTDLHGRPSPPGYEGPQIITQVVFISKTITVRGGYTTTNEFADPPAPEVYSTTLDAEGEGRVIFIAGDITSTIEGLSITGGDATGLIGHPWGMDHGGGVYVVSATVTIDNSRVFRNNAVSGGGLFVYDGTIALTSSSITRNGGYLSDFGCATGGGLSSFGSDATILNNVFSRNWEGGERCGNGGGLALRGSNATVMDNVITENSVSGMDDGFGGGILLSGSNAILIRNIISDNRVGGDWRKGVGLWIYSSIATLVDNIISGNDGYGGDYCDGGGLYASGSDIVLAGNTISDNHATSGGGLLLRRGSATLIGNRIKGNSGPVAVWLVGLSVMNSVDGTDVAEAIHTYSQSRVDANHIRYLGMRHCCHPYNSDPSRLSDGDALLMGNTISGNNGSGLWLSFRETGYALLAGNTISGNNGTGLGVSATSATLINNRIVGNSGTGLWLYSDGAVLNNNIIARNQSSVHRTSGVYVSSSSSHFSHNTIADNTGGSAVSVSGSDTYGYNTVYLTNTILVSHTVGITVAEGNTVTMEATLWGSGEWGNDLDWGGEGAIVTGTINIWDEPAFVDPDAGDYHIGASSAAIDTGVDAGVVEDIDGDLRPIDGGYDIGADEFPYLLIHADFDAAPTSGIAPLTVVFTNTSTGDFTTSLWSFGDSFTSAQPSPTHTYSIRGTYTPTLTVSGPGGIDAITRTNFITVYETVQAGFTASPTTGLTPLAVSFVNTSTGDYTDSLWSFGDGFTSTLPSPTHTYEASGFYTVSLRVSGFGATETLTKSNYIQVFQPVLAQFTAWPTTGLAPLTVLFTNTSTGDFTGSLWSFGDGMTSTMQSPTHIYDTGGVYTVTLTVSGAGGIDTETKERYITVRYSAFLPLVLRNY